jgi:hypothetical protein
MRKTDAQIEQDLLEAIKPLIQKWDDDYINGMKALGYSEEEAWMIVGRKGINADLFSGTESTNT